MKICLIAVIVGIIISGVPATAPSDGAALYKATCAACHAANGSGETPAGKLLKVRDLRSAQVQKKSNAEFAKIISDGKGKMPAYRAKLSAQDIQALVAYIRTLR